MVVRAMPGARNYALGAVERVTRNISISKMAYALWISALVQGFITQTARFMDWCNFSHLDGVGDVVYITKYRMPNVISPMGGPEGVSNESTSVHITVLK